VTVGCLRLQESKSKVHALAGCIAKIRNKQTLVGVWCKPSDTGVWADGVVERFDVAENRRFGRTSRGQILQIDAFAFQAGKEVFG